MPELREFAAGVMLAGMRMGKTLQNKRFIISQGKCNMNKLAVILSGTALLVSIAALVLLSQISKQVEFQSGTIAAKVDQQSMLINRALGNVMPLVLPPDVENKIAVLEGQLADKSRWPRDPREVQKQMTDLVNNLPPWAQEELLPRLLPRMWELDAVEILTFSTGVLESDLLMTAKAENLLTQKPLTASDNIAQELDAWQKNIEKKIAEAEKNSALASAKESLVKGVDIEAAAQALSPYQDPEAQALLEKLNAEITKRGVSSQISAIQTELTKMSNVDAEVKEYAYNRAFQELLDLKSRVVLAGLSGDIKLQQQVEAFQRDLQRKFPEIMKEKQKKYAGKVREYQQWALSQIKNVRQYDDVCSVEKEKISSDLDRINPLSGESKEASLRSSSILRDEIIRLLAPINQSLLDEAVNQLFRKVYQSRFDKLNEDDQFEVIKGFALADKRPLEG